MVDAKVVIEEAAEVVRPMLGVVGGGGVSVVKLANGVGMSVGVGGAGNRGNAIASGREVGVDSGVG